MTVVALRTSVPVLRVRLLVAAFLMLSLWHTTGWANMQTGADAPPDRYEVTVDRNRFPIIDVSADIEVGGGRLEMFPGLDAAFPEPGGFAAHVRDLDVRDPTGKPLEAVREPGPAWRLPGLECGRVRLRYSVDMSYAGRSFATGNEQIGFLDEGGLFATGFALFIYSGADRPARISVAVPAGWDLTTSWPVLANGDFRARDRNSLIRNILAVGKGYRSIRTSRQGFELRMLLFGHHRESERRVREVILPLVDYYVGIFGASRQGHFTFAMLPGPNDGEGYMDSFASSQPPLSPVDESFVWANSLAHELFHHWNGSRISSRRENYAERQWFSEGFTEYYANRALLATGLIDRATYDEILAQYLSFHLLFAQSEAFADVTMRSAGSRKGRYRPGVYDSGVAAAFCLDGLITRASQRQRNLDDLMRLLDERFGETRLPLVFEDIGSAASEVAGVDLGEFFERHVEGRDPLPLEECAEAMGYRAIVDGYHLFLKGEGGEPQFRPVASHGSPAAARDLPDATRSQRKSNG